ncbi:fibronectin type III domain-containing protein [Chryseobacterium jejuense]|uniref:Por secretion system C-terminal sorting domain n=1 Tax=Chryseobacterium jejuense TaxID=445960 RepID=A0A2X2X2Y8_CHRJE|nr:fibronectin type III domain-containing protein [Chryseobacterium jejuense]SDJ53503.1 Por secretion system C-terminal sorting domain-containing protein [Chryseobacterium jejuense]SQB46287.1 Por secretion system C-terminal sorting domain [Chryseobacterium jejuense]
MSGLLLCKMSRPFKVLIALLCMAIGLSIQAQTITIGTGTLTQKYPLGASYGFERSASIYTAAEIAAAGGTAGSILSLGWNSTTAFNTGIPVKIYIKAVPNTTLTAQNWAAATSGATLLYNGTLGLIPAAWYTVPLQLPYTYNGVDNLMVLVETNYGGFGSSNAGAKLTYSSVPTGHMYIQAYTTAPTGNGTVTGNRPNIQMTFGTPPACLPMPPGGTLSTGAVTATNAVINWTAYVPAPAAGYDVFYNTTNIPPVAGSTPNLTVPPGAPTATIGPLNPLTTYYVWVRAKCSATEQSVWSTSLVFATPATCPAMPSSGAGITTGTITATSAVINWPSFGYTPALGFDIYYNTTGAAPNGTTIPMQNVPSGTTATLTPLLPNTTYYVWVRARCSATDQSTWNITPGKLLTPPTCVPVPSAAGSLTIGAMTPNSAVVNWQASPSAPAGGYEVYYTTTNTPPTATTPGTVVSGTSTTLSPLVPGTTYYWWVRAICTPTDKSTWVAGPAFAPGQIGTGTDKTEYLPVYSYYGYNYSQQIYTAAEVLGAVGAGKFITELKFYVDTPASPADQGKYNEWVVYMGNTTQNNFSGSSNWVPYSSLKKVWEGTLPTMTAGTWVTIPLTTPLLWDGTSNLVIAVDENSPLYVSSSWGSYKSTVERGMLFRDDTTNPDPASPPSAPSSSGRYKDIPRIRLTGVELLPCTSAPPTNIAVSNITPSTAVVTWTPALGATYKLQYRPNSGGPWKIIDITTPLTSSWSLYNLTDATTYEVQIATICNGTQGAFSPSKQFITPALTYCANVPPAGTSPSGYIGKVVVTPTNAPLMVSNSGYDGYKDYSTDPTRLVTFVRGTSGNKINITKFWPGSTSSYGVGVWIDLNRNGIFEPTERVVNATSSTTNPVGTVAAGFTIALPPNSATYDGTLLTRMRVVMMDGTVSSPCASFGTYNDGEVEDYAVRLIDQPLCTTAPPTNITVSNITDKSATFSWLAATGATYQLQYREVGTVAWTQVPSTSIPAPGNVYTIPTTAPLKEQTKYEVQVATKCTGGFGSYSSSVQFITLPLQYCPITGSGDNDHISNVTVISSNSGVPPMSNPTAQNSYTSYSTPATLITLDAGSNDNKLIVAKGWTGSTGNDAVAVWIDFDRNGQFDTAERILASPASTTTPITTLFNVPAAPPAYIGQYTTTMRVVLKRSTGTTIPTACANAIDGEVEDYAVRIRPCSNVTPNVPTFPLATITHTTAGVNLTGGSNIVTYLVRYRVAGTGTWTQIYASAALGNLPLTLTGLSPATTYEVDVAAVCGGTTGTPTAITTFTTRCDPTPPTVTISNITPTSALITWNPVVNSATYKMRWRKVGAPAWSSDVPLPGPGNTYQLNNLESFVTYEVQIANQCAGETSWNNFSNSKVFTTERICEIAPPGLTITQLLPTTAEVTWDAYPGATYVLRYRKVGIPSWTEVPTAVNTIILNGLVEMTKYEMQVVNICSGKPGTYTPPYYFTTPTVIYCKMKSENSAGEYISKVTVIPNGKTKMENESKGSSYTDYTGVPKTFIELIQGSTDNEIIIEKKWLGKTYNEGIAVWIDFNRNGEFDIYEKVFSSAPNTTTPVSGKFNVPADAFVSTTDYKYVVMRVAMERDGIPVNCVNVKNGEVEDYTVRISKAGVPNPINQTDILIYPNPVSSILHVKNISKKAKYKIYNAAGQIIVEGILLNNEINVTKLINGVYVIDIDDNGNNAQRKFIKE